METLDRDANVSRFQGKTSRDMKKFDPQASTTKSTPVSQTSVLGNFQSYRSQQFIEWMAKIRFFACFERLREMMSDMIKLY